MLILRPILLLCVGAVSASLVQAKAPPVSKPPLKDGEQALPADYAGWPKFLSEVQRPDAKQVREIYMNKEARTATAAKGFPDGSVFVMENYAAKLNPDGTPQTDARGKLLKGELARIFVMGKNPGWGADAPEGQRTGSWIFSSYLPDGQKSTDDLGKCRTCHAPLATKDFVHRYDEYFQAAAKR
jgi:hemoglobin